MNQSHAKPGGTAKLTFKDKSYDLPVLSGSVGPDVIDIRKLYAETDAFTYDPGFTSTASCESQITYIDGDAGILLYRGYPIDQLAEQGDFLETCYLLLHGELPNATQMKEFDRAITYHTMLHEQLSFFYRGFRRDAHPMAIMVGTVGALSAFYHDSLDINDLRQRTVASHRLIAKMPTIAAMAFKYSMGQPFIYPRNDLGYAENFLRMCFAVPAEDYKVNPVLARALDRIFILHADHEQNASTSTVRLAGSSGANPFACIAAGIACLWGPAHGGANEAALKMLEDIGTVDKIPAYIAKVKDKSSNVRLMGFGHRVYKNGDHRAPILNKLGRKLAQARGATWLKWFEIGDEVEKIMLRDKSIHPNVDFPCGMTYYTMDIPVPQYTPIFVASRVSGWCAHVMEQHANNRLIRPLSIYVGEPRRSWSGS